jgi:hypothetical protein
MADGRRDRVEEELMVALAELAQARTQLSGYRRIAREVWRWLAQDHPELVREFRDRLDNLDRGGDDDAASS